MTSAYISYVNRHVRAMMGLRLTSSTAAMANKDLVSKCAEFASKRQGIAAFKDLQYQAVSSVLRGQDTFVSLSTGYGKSAIYQAIPLREHYDIAL